MTKDEKVKFLSVAMARSTRNNGSIEDGTKFYHFTDEAPEELKSLFLEHFEVRDLDYEIFNEAIDMLENIYEDEKQETDGVEFVEEAIYNDREHASPYTSDRLEYLNIWNEDEISNMVRDTSNNSIAEACAYWYDQEVQRAAIILKDWINA